MKRLIALLALCVSLAASAQVSIWTKGYTFNPASPGPIGTGTPSPGVFLTVDVPTVGAYTAEMQSAGFGMAGNACLSWAPTASYANIGDIVNVKDTVICRDGVGIAAQRVTGANPQTFRIYNTFTDASNYERLEIGWNSSTATIAHANAGTGAARSLSFNGAALQFRTGGGGVSGGTARWDIASGGTLTASTDNSWDIGASGSGRPGNVWAALGVNAQRFNATQGLSPTMGACGTSPTVSGHDSGMLVTVGTGGVATSCAVNFQATWTNPPVCVVQNNTDRVSYSIVTTATVLTITATAAITASSKFHVICLGQ